MRQYFDERTVFHVDLYEQFVMGDSQCNAVLTGREIIVDTYDVGELTKEVLSGKNFFEVDRSAACAAREDS